MCIRRQILCALWIQQLKTKPEEVKSLLVASGIFLRGKKYFPEQRLEQGLQKNNKPQTAHHNFIKMCSILKSSFLL